MWILNVKLTTSLGNTTLILAYIGRLYPKGVPSSGSGV